MSGQVARTAFTPGKSREQTDADRAQVKKAKLIRRAESLNIKHLFAVIGLWSPYYARVILTNSLVWAALEVHVIIYFFLTVVEDNINFQGISTDPRLKYTPIVGLEAFSLKSILRGSDLDESGRLATITATGFYNVKLAMKIYGAILAAVSVALMSKWPHQRKIAVAAIIYLTGIVLACISNNFPIVKLVLVVAVTCKEICVLAVLMNLTQNLPSHIRPIAFFWLSTVKSILSSGTLLSFRLSSYWPPIGLVVPGVLLVSATVHFFLAPDSLLLIVLEQEGDVLKRLIKKYKEDRPAIDGNTLIDDVIYIRPATVSSWKRCLKLLIVKPFIFKYLILVALLSLFLVRDDMTTVSQFKMMNLGLLEAFFMRYVAVFLGGMTAMIMLHFYGRRLTLVSSYLFNIACLAVFLTIPLRVFNTCTLFSSSSSANEKWTNLLISSNFLQTVSFYTAETTVILMLMEHIPVEDHKYLVPLAFMIGNIAVAVTRSILRENFVLAAIPYPNVDYFICFVLTLLCGILLPFLDNTRILPLKSDEFKCYYFKKLKYPRNPIYRDDSDLTELPESSGGYSHGSHSATLEDK